MVRNDRRTDSGVPEEEVSEVGVSCRATFTHREVYLLQVTSGPVFLISLGPKNLNNFTMFRKDEREFGKTTHKSEIFSVFTLCQSQEDASRVLAYTSTSFVRNAAISSLLRPITSSNT